MNRYLVNFAKKLLSILLIIVSLSFIQWCSLTLYNNYCYDPSWFGFITNIKSLGSPFCMFFNKLQVSIMEYYGVYVMSICGIVMTLLKSIN